MTRKLRMGMIGGSLEAFIGSVHRKAASLDGRIEIVCGAFSSDATRSKKTGKSLFLDAKRVYDSYDQMLEMEKNLPEDERMDFVSIVTPNHVHFDPAKKALENGFPVIIDKPLSFSLAEANILKKLVKKTGLPLAVTYTYTGYPMVKEARQLVKSNKLGTIRKVYVEYPQGWLTKPLEKSGQKQAAWRTDPTKAGNGGAIGDIGTHAFNLAEYITGLRVTEICAELNAVVKDRLLDDDSAMLVHFENNASGTLVATQVAAGEENNVKIRVYGEKGSLEWKHEDPNSLFVRWTDQPTQIYRTGASYISAAAAKNTRFPSGHPEGYLEAFANIYVAFEEAVRDWQKGKEIDASRYDYPDVEKGLRGMEFVEAVIKSSKSSKKWTKI